MTKLPRDIEKKFNAKQIKINPTFKAQLKNNLFQEEIMANKAKKSRSSISFIQKYNLAPVLIVMFLVVFVGTASAAVTTSRVNQTREQEIELPSDLAAVLSIDDIRAIAAAEVTEASITGIELEQEDGVLVYKVRFSDGSYRLYDANTGAALNKDTVEVDESVPAGFVAGISLQEARTIAQAQRTGKTITKIELEVEDGVVVYSVRFSDGGRVNIDASNGSVLAVKDSSSNDSSGNSTSSSGSDDDSSDDSSEVESEIEDDHSEDHDSDKDKDDDEEDDSSNSGSGSRD